MPSDTLTKTLTAGQWALANTLVQKTLSLGTFFILARLLVPADFGVVALAAIVPSLIEGVTTFAFDTAVVQKQGDIRRYLNVIWTFMVLRGIAIFLIVFFCAPFIASFFHIEYALPLLRLAGATILLQGLVNIGQTYFFIDLDFKKLFIRDLSLGISYSIATISLAFIFHSYWAPFLGSIVAAFVVLIATYMLHPYRPYPDVAFGKLRDLLGFSQWLFGQELLNQAARTLEDTLLGRFTSAAALGIYGKSKSLASAPTSPVSSLINKVGFTSYARTQDSLGQVREGVHKTFELMLAIALPYYLVLLIAGDRIVLMLLGPNWAVITPYLKFLALATTIEMLTISLATPVLNAIGLQRAQFFIRSVATGTIIAGLAVLVPLYGIWGAVAASIISVSITACVTVYLLVTHIRIDLGRIASNVVIVAVASAAPIGIASYLLHLSFFYHTLGYILLVAFSGSLYVLLLILLGVLTNRGPYPTLRLVARSFPGAVPGGRVLRALGILQPIETEVDMPNAQ